MHSKRTILLALVALVLVLPFGTSIAAADSGTSASSSQPVSFSLMGMVTNAGTQSYELRGGQLMTASIMGQPINPYTATLDYSMFSLVDGLNTWGYSHLVLNAQTVGGQNVNVEAWTFINDSMSLELPIGCSTTCTSEIPEFFMGGSIVTVALGSNSQTVELPMGIESAYLNPFGGPIVISSLENPINPAIFLVANYTVANINWFGVQMGGQVSGTFGKTSGQGIFTMNVNSRENLVTGIEQDRGTIVLTGVGPNGQNVEGTFRGTSVVPTTGALPCPSSLGLPPTTCTMLGLNSAGSMKLHSGNYQIRGAYATAWGIPAIGFTSTVSATATPMHDHSHHSHNQMEQDN